MDAQRISSAVLSAINDGLHVVEYGHGHLVTMPSTYYDNDRVTLFVEPYERGFRVTDRGMTAMRLHSADLNLDGDRARSAWDRSVAASELFNPSPDDLEIADWGDESKIAEMLLKVTDASVRADQLRWLATDRRPQRFSDRVVSSLIRAVKDADEVLPYAPLTLRSGRNRRVTASVGLEAESKVFVQAVGGRSNEAQELAVERCYHLFNLAKQVPKDRRLAYAAGSRRNWSGYALSELGEVCDLAFEDDSEELLHGYLSERLPSVAIASP